MQVRDEGLLRCLALSQLCPVVYDWDVDIAHVEILVWLQGCLPHQRLLA